MGEVERFEQMNNVLQQLGHNPFSSADPNEIRGSVFCQLTHQEAEQLAAELGGRSYRGQDTNAHHQNGAAVGMWVATGVWHERPLEELRRRLDAQKHQSISVYFKKAGWV